MQKILLSAYSCAPNRGSEPGVGWNAAVAMAKHAEIHVLTSFEFKEQIENLIINNQMPQNLFVHFFDLPFARFWWKHPKLIQLHYYLWQLFAGKTVKKLHKKYKFDSAQHITFVRYWQPSCLRNSGIPYIFGPVAGGDLPPKGLVNKFSVKQKIVELIRKLVRFCGETDYFVRETLKNAKFIIAATASTEERIQKLIKDNNKIVSCLAIGISESELNNLKQIPSPTETYNFCGLGLIIPRKGFDMAIKAIAKTNNSNIKFTIIGDGPERTALEELAKENKVNLEITGFLSHEEAMNKLENMVALIHPCYHESGGCAVQEAMAAGKPVICLDHGGPGFLVQNDTGIKIHPENYDYIINQMSIAIQELYSDLELVKKLGLEARKTIQNHHTWEAKADFYISLHRKLFTPHK